VGNFEQAFASGYLLGEVMARCNLQPDFAKFSGKNTPDARINNYTRLQPSLGKIGVQLDTRTVTSLVREERGAATRLLSSLRMNLDAMVRDVEKAKVGTKLGRTAMSAGTKPSLGVAESFRRTGNFNNRQARVRLAKLPELRNNLTCQRG